MNNYKQFVLATLAGGIAMWLLAGLWHKVIMVQFYTAETGVQHEGAGIILLAYLILSFITAYLFSKLYQGGSYTWQGLKLGAIIGVLWVFPHELAMAGAHGEPLSYVFKNGAWHVIEQAVGGVIIAWVYGRFANREGHSNEQ